MQPIVLITRGSPSTTASEGALLSFASVQAEQLTHAKLFFEGRRQGLPPKRRIAFEIQSA